MSEKKKFSIDSIVITTLILFLICVVITFALAGTNYITKGRIAELEENNQKSSMALVLSADDYREEGFVYPSGAEVTYYVALKDDETVGYIYTTSAKGYGGDINVMTGIDKDGKITAVKILSADDETPGLGANVTKKSFYSQFTDKTAGFELVKNSATDDNQVVAVTGATISSTAVKNAVQEAFELFKLRPKEQPETQSDENTDIQTDVSQVTDENTSEEEGEE